MAAERPTFIASLGPIAPHGVVPAAGGVIVVDGTGVPIGAVGVTGDTSDNDEACALADQCGGSSRSGVGRFAGASLRWWVADICLPQR